MFINELADLCEQVGTDVNELALGVGLDHRIGSAFLKAGPGYGGSCFPKDTMALLRTAQDHGVALRIVEETVAANEARKRKMALKVLDAVGGDMDGKVIAVLGLT
jgi:UDPglucose 6-dehydrogenase